MPADLAPRLAFPGAESAWVVGHVIAVLFALLLIWRLLRWEQQLTSSRVGWLLLGLRASCLLVILLALFQPTWAWIISRSETGRIVVALDVSDSMGTTDPQATSHERLGWAVAMGWLNRGVIPAEPPNETPTALPAGVDPRVWSDVLDRLKTISRAEVGRRVLTEGHRPLLSELKSLGTVDLHWFGGVSQSLTPTALDVPLKQLPSSRQASRPR